MRKPTRCKNCNRVLHVSKDNPGKIEYCPLCIERYGYKALQLQKESGKKIEDLIIERSEDFTRLDYMADSLGVSYNTLIKWIRKFFLVDEVWFKKIFVCKSSVCSVVRVKDDYRYKFINEIKDKTRCHQFLKQKYFCVRMSREELEKILKSMGKRSFEILSDKKQFKKG